MTRKKKARRIGSEGPAQYNDRQLSKLDIAALARKKSQKKKGNKAGSRHSSSSEMRLSKTPLEKDPRLGSKVSISLTPAPVAPHPKSNAAKKIRKLTAEQELAALENDPQLNVLLDRLEQGEKLGSGLQAYVDEKLDRIEVLMTQLGLLEDEPVKTKLSKKTDDDLLDRFQNNDWDGL